MGERNACAGPDNLTYEGSQLDAAEFNTVPGHFLSDVRRDAIRSKGPG